VCQDNTQIREALHIFHRSKDEYVKKYDLKLAKNMERFTNLRVILAPKTGDGYG